MDRYLRQRTVEDGKSFDQAWAETSILLVGLGGVGTPLAQILTRSGIGQLTLVDGDRVHDTDLHRQLLYDDKDVISGIPKAEAAYKFLSQIGGRTSLRSYAGMLTPRNALELFEGHDFVIDATDHIAARSLIQETSLQSAIGWFHSAAIADRWIAASFTPPGSPCYHCWVAPELNEVSIGTCETVGVLPATCMAAASAVFRLLTMTLQSPLDFGGTDPRHPENSSRRILRGSLAEGERWVELFADPNCPTCSSSALEKSVDMASGHQREAGYPMRRLCGSGSLEVWIDKDIDTIQQHLISNSPLEKWRKTPFSLRIEDPAGAITCYRDGRALITGDLAKEPTTAKKKLAQILDF